MLLNMERVLLLCNELSEQNPTGRHCTYLKNYLSEKGIDTETVSFSTNQQDKNVHSARPIVGANNPFNWAMLANNEMKMQGREIHEKKGFDLIHAHDWITAPAGMALAKLTEKPLIFTLHSTENNRGFCNQHSQVVSSIEWWATFEARKVIVDNLDAYNSVKYDLNLPEHKVRLIDPMQFGWQEKVLEEYQKAKKQAVKA